METLPSALCSLKTGASALCSSPARTALVARRRILHNDALALDLVALHLRDRPFAGLLLNERHEAEAFTQRRGRPQNDTSRTSFRYISTLLEWCRTRLTLSATFSTQGAESFQGDTLVLPYTSDIARSPACAPGDG